MHQQASTASPPPSSGGGTPAVVTVSSAFGAGGNAVAHAVAGRLHVPFYDRAIHSAVAEQLHSQPAAPAARERPQSPLTRLLHSLAGTSALTPSQVLQASNPIAERGYQQAVEDFLRDAAKQGGVFLGRAAAIVLRDAPAALHVRLYGPRDSRLRQTIRGEGVDDETAARRLDDHDRARLHYVQYFYGQDAQDPKHYHLMIDGTAVDRQTCVELILRAQQARLAASSAAPTDVRAR